MDEFILIFRRDFISRELRLSPDQLQASIKLWQQWFSDLQNKGHLSRPIQVWDSKGLIVDSAQLVREGPYAEILESISGFIFIIVQDYAQAIVIARECPLITLGGNVEVRKLICQE